jgi:hypothetical protein
MMLQELCLLQNEATSLSLHQLAPIRLLWRLPKTIGIKRFWFLNHPVRFLKFLLELSETIRNFGAEQILSFCFNNYLRIVSLVIEQSKPDMKAQQPYVRYKQAVTEKKTKRL